eukprot:2171435-Rhodomonas_salina.1
MLVTPIEIATQVLSPSEVQRKYYGSLPSSSSPISSSFPRPTPPPTLPLSLLSQTQKRREGMSRIAGPKAMEAGPGPKLRVDVRRKRNGVEAEPDSSNSSLPP